MKPFPTEVDLIADWVKQSNDYYQALTRHFPILQLANKLAQRYSSGGTYLQAQQGSVVSSVDFAWGLGTHNGLVMHLHAQNDFDLLQSGFILREVENYPGSRLVSSFEGKHQNNPQEREVRFIFLFSDHEEKPASLTIKIWRWNKVSTAT